MISPSKCPVCGGLYYAVPRCKECDWVDPDWKKYEDEMIQFWIEHKEEIRRVLKSEKE